MSMIVDFFYYFYNTYYYFCVCVGGGGGGWGRNWSGVALWALLSCRPIGLPLSAVVPVFRSVHRLSCLTLSMLYLCRMI